MKRSKKSKKIENIIFLIVVALVIWVFFSKFVSPPTSAPNLTLIESNGEETISNWGEVEVNFIDVGQADSCLIVTEHNDLILIDTGDDKKAEAIIKCLNQYSFDDIDLMILTHPDADHISGAQTVIETYTVSEVVMSSYVKTTKLFTNLLNCLDEKDIIVTQAAAGDVYSIDGVDMEIIGADWIPKDCNSSSVVSKMNYGNVSVLFTGDIETKAENLILNTNRNISADVLKVGHHGSDTSTSDKFLLAVSPELAIISVGKNNKYNHPDKKTLDKLSSNGVEYYRTDEYGTIKLIINGSNKVKLVTRELEREFIF